MVCLVCSFLTYWAGLQKDDDRALLEAGIATLKATALEFHAQVYTQGGDFFFEEIRWRFEQPDPELGIDVAEGLAALHFVALSFGVLAVVFFSFSLLCLSPKPCVMALKLVR